MSVDVMLREPPPLVHEIAPPTREKVSLDRYFVIADARELPVEYLDGELFYMDGTYFEHGVIQIRIANLLDPQLARDEYTMVSSHVAVRPRGRAYFHPDLTVLRGEPRFDRRRRGVRNPVLVLEVLSPSTRDHDLDTKLPIYRTMPTMEHILIIEQDRPCVQHHSRVDGEWTQREFTNMDDIVRLDSMGASMSLAQIYRGVDFPQS